MNVPTLPPMPDIKDFKKFDSEEVLTMHYTLALATWERVCKELIEAFTQALTAGPCRCEEDEWCPRCDP